jgi:amino acid transporter
MEPTTNAAKEPRKFGTFGGVFVPNVLTILGVIMFLRTGWVVGQAGLKDALIILLIANVITLLTSLSLSSISTNIQVKGGGAYFLISRNLGLEIGGSVGIPLFLAQAVSVAFYIIGFAESLQYLWPNLPVRWVTLVTLLVIFAVAWKGADLAIKAQYVILGALGLALISFFGGWTPAEGWGERIQPAYESGLSFWLVFAIFFPAVTGIMSGVSMSGDLRDPSKSVPRGTILAVIVCFVIYALQMVWLSINATREELVSNSLVMERIAVVGPLIFVGLWAATLSSALASLLAAPRTLQAMAQDRIVPFGLGRGHGPGKEPRIAMLVTAGLAALCLMAGRLDVIAPIISMFFLTTYGTVNLVAGLSGLAANPSYRPTFRVHWLPCLLGTGGCLFAMFLLNAWATVFAVACIIGLYTLLKRRQYQTAWGDERSGIWFALARFGLLKLAASRQHVRNWRPVILVLVGNPANRQSLVGLANRMEARRGLLFLSQIVIGDWEKVRSRQGTMQRQLDDFIRENRLSAVGKTVMADSFEQGVSTLIQVAGVGALEPNTVLMGWSEDALRQREFTGAVRRILELKRNLLIFAEADLPQRELEPVIDVWWRAKNNGSFMLTLAHLWQEGAVGREYRLRVRRIIASEEGRRETELAMREMVRTTRYAAEIDIVVSKAPPLDVIGRESEKSALCFVGVNLDAVADDASNPVAGLKPLVAALKGEVVLAKSWLDLHAHENP